MGVTGVLESLMRGPMVHATQAPRGISGCGGPTYPARCRSVREDHASRKATLRFARVRSGDALDPVHGEAALVEQLGNAGGELG